MEKEKCIKEIGRFALRPIGLVQAVSVLVLFSSPFVWIWGTWYFAWRIALTAIIVIILSYHFYNMVYKAFEDRYDEALKNYNEGKKVKKVGFKKDWNKCKKSVTPPLPDGGIKQEKI